MEIFQFKVYIQNDSLIIKFTKEPKKKKIADDNVENNDQVIMPGLETGTFWVIGRHDKDNNKKSRQDLVKIFFIKLYWSNTTVSYTHLTLPTILLV